MRLRPSTISAVRLAAAALLAATIASGCQDSPTGPSVAPFTISGSVTNNTGTPLPANARALVLWEVSATDPDYGYIYGEGMVDPATNRFSITLDGAPPAAALNAGVLGVGMVVVTADQTIREGRLDAAWRSVLGATPQHAVIFRRGALPAGASIPWVSAFPQGYAVGRGVPHTDTYDDFEPVAASTMELIVDALENMNFVNWT